MLIIHCHSYLHSPIKESVSCIETVTYTLDTRTGFERYYPITHLNHTATVMLGAITEKKPSKVAALVVNNNGGFPPVLRMVQKPLARKTDTDKATTIAENKKFIVSSTGTANQLPQTKTKIGSCNEMPVDEVSAMNACTVDGMSPEEIAHALEEIRSLLSPKSIEFLQKSPLPTEQSRAARGVKESLPVPQIHAVPNRPKISATEDPWCGNQSIQGADSNRAVVPAENPFAERFDLNGRKVVDRATVAGKIMEEVVKSGLFTLRKGLVEEVGTGLAAICLDCLRPVARSRDRCAGYFVWHNDALEAAQAQPQDELKHHQYENEAPGYTLREILEMFRSEFANQRIVAMRMLSGILLRRDCAVAMEAYSETFSANAAAVEEDEVDGDIGCGWGQVEDELGRRSSILSDLSLCFEDLVRRASLILCTSTSTSGGDAVSGIDLIPAASAETGARPSLSWEHTRQVRKLLCWCSLHLLCASDLPVELPTLLLWALSSNINAPALGDNDGDTDDLQLAPSFGQAAPRNNPAVAKLGLLRCLHMYLGSPAEEASVDWLRRKSILWSAYGAPRLAAPHTRRTGAASYEQDMADSLVRATKFLNEEDEEQQDDDEEGEQVRRARLRTPDSVAEAFALQCRWSRISAMVSRSSVIALLTSHVISAVEALLDAASDKKAFSSSGDVLTALGMASLQLLALIARQGNADILPVLHKQFLRPSWRTFVTMSDSEHVRSSESDLHALYRRWWHILAEFVTRDRTVAVFLFDTHGEWTDATVLRLVLQNCNDDGEDARIGAPNGESLRSVALRVVKSSLVFGLGFRCVTEILLADQAASAVIIASSVDLLTLLEQAAVSASAVLSATSSSASQVPFGLPKALDDLTQASSSIFAFTKRHWSRLQGMVLDAGHAVEAKAAVLSFLSVVFRGAKELTATGVPQPLDNIDLMCRFRMAQSLSGADCCLRGCGLISSAVRFNAQLLAQEQQKVGGGSVTAAMLHLSGQGSDLARFAAGQELFSPEVVGRCVAAQIVAATENRRGSVQWLQSQEYFLSLLGHLTCTIDLLTTSSSLLIDNSVVESIVRSADCCCAALETPYLLFANNEGSNSSVRLAGGSVGEGVIMWHFQRIQQAGLILQATSAAALLRRLPNNVKLGAALDGLLSTHLHSLTANSHCSILIALFRAYLRRLVLAAQNMEEKTSLTDLYDANAVSYDPLCVMVTSKAFGCDIEKVDAYTGINGISLSRYAGDWLTLRGPESSAIVLKPNWAYEVLLGDVSGDQLADWLQILLQQQIRGSSSTLQTQGNGRNVSALAIQIYTLLKLSTSDQALKWTAGTEDGDGGGLLESNQRAVQAYRELMIQLVGSTKFHISFTAAFCQVVSKEYFATTGMMSAHRHKARAARSGPAKYASLEGVLDLCEKALDAGLNQVIDEQLHAVVLVVMSSPLLPWAVRQRVWAQLASLRLVHLLEDRAVLLSLLPILLPAYHSPSLSPSLSGQEGRCGPHSSESHSLFVEVINALSDLRSTEDRSWTIVAVSIMQMTHFIFAGTSVYVCDATSTNSNSTLNKLFGQRAQLLVHLLEQRNTAGSAAAWISHAVLLHAASMHRRAQQSAGGLDQSPQLEELGALVEEVRVWSGQETSIACLSLNTLQVEIKDGEFQQLGDLATREHK